MNTPRWKQDFEKTAAKSELTAQILKLRKESQAFLRKKAKAIRALQKLVTKEVPEQGSTDHPADRPQRNVRNIVEAMAEQLEFLDKTFDRQWDRAIKMIDEGHRE